MKTSFKNKLMKTLILMSVALTSIHAAQASCSNMIQNDMANRKNDLRLARNDFIGASIFSIPAAALFLPAGVIFEGTALTYKIIAKRKVVSAEKCLAIYEEAAKNGGKYTERLYRKLQRSHPAVEISFEKFLSEIHESDISEKGCSPGTVPTKKEILNMIDENESSND